MRLESTITWNIVDENTLDMEIKFKMDTNEFLRIAKEIYDNSGNVSFRNVIIQNKQKEIE